MYLWCPGNLSPETSAWIANTGITNQKILNASHWPTMDRTNETAAAIKEFFDSCQWQPLAS